MVRFTQAQKAEFDKLYAKKDSMTLLDVLQEVQRNERNYPVLYLYLFGSDDNYANQDSFARVWLDPSLITVSITQYYLVLFPQMYISLDPDKQIKFTDKWDFTVAYQKQFTQVDIDRLQLRDEFKNRVNLGSCKVEVSADDEANPQPLNAPSDVTVNVDDDTATIEAS